MSAPTPNLLKGAVLGSCSRSGLKNFYGEGRLMPCFKDLGQSVRDFRPSQNTVGRNRLRMGKEV